MNKYRIVKISDVPELMDAAAEWFHDKWGIPTGTYKESMTDSLKPGVSVPAWYLCLDDERIIAGMGVIENDFHERKEFAPNVCAVYTEPGYRGKGIAGRLLDFVCGDMLELGIDTLYLVTNHTGFYERYGWEYLCMVNCDGEDKPSRMYIHRS